MKFCFLSFFFCNFNTTTQHLVQKYTFNLHRVTNFDSIMYDKTLKLETAQKQEYV